MSTVCLFQIMIFHSQFQTARGATAKTYSAAAKVPLCTRSAMITTWTASRMELPLRESTTRWIGGHYAPSPTFLIGGDNIWFVFLLMGMKKTVNFNNYSHQIQNLLSKYFTESSSPSSSSSSAFVVRLLHAEHNSKIRILKTRMSAYVKS